MNKNTHNTVLRAKKVQELTAQHYEPGRHDRCKKWVYRNVIVKIYPMSERTFFRLLSTKVDESEDVIDDPRQSKLF